jgi:hypothetical protein
MSWHRRCIRYLHSCSYAMAALPGPHWHNASHQTPYPQTERSIPTNPVEVAVSVVKHCVEVKRSRAEFAFTVWKHRTEESLIWLDYDLDIFGRCNEAAIWADCEAEFACTRNQCMDTGLVRNPKHTILDADEVFKRERGLIPVTTFLLETGKEDSAFECDLSSSLGEWHFGNGFAE